MLSHFIHSGTCKWHIPMSLSSFTDSVEKCKSSEGSGELGCELRGIDEDQSISGK